MVHSRPFLFVAFACVVIADPVSSVAYAIQAALRARGGRLDLPVPTIGYCVAVAAVGFTLAVSLGRGYPLASLAAALTIAGSLYALWFRAGRPSGIAQAERLAEAEPCS